MLLFLIGAPVLFLLCAVSWLIYWHGFNGKERYPRLLERIQRINPRLLFIASLLAILTLAVYTTAEYATHFGFPTTIITYHGPRNAGLPTTWPEFVGRVGINPLSFLINAGVYLLLLLGVERLWKTRTYS